MRSFIALSTCAYPQGYAVSTMTTLGVPVDMGRFGMDFSLKQCGYCGTKGQDLSCKSCGAAI